MKSFRVLVFVVLFSFGTVVIAQEQPSTPAQNSAQTSEATPAQHAAGPSDALAHQSNEAAGEGEEHAEFKHSPSVKLVAKLTGLSLNAAYWLLVVINFLIIAVLIGWALKKNLPGTFRARTDSIRKSMDEARRASEDANRRLSDIENRLSHLDREIADMKSKAETDAAAEEQRLRAAAEDDRRKIVEGAEQEIEAAAKAARRELKSYVADLAVTLAEKRIQVDRKTDEALVQTFVGQLGKDGR